MLTDASLVIALVALLVAVGHALLRSRESVPTVIVRASDGRVEQGSIKVLAFSRDRLKGALSDGVPFAFVPFSNDPEYLKSFTARLGLDNGQVYEVAIMESSKPLG